MGNKVIKQTEEDIEARAYCSLIQKEFPNPLEVLFNLYPTIKWNFYYLSASPNITLAMVKNNMNLPWVWSMLQKNYSLPWDFIVSKEFQDKLKENKKKEKIYKDNRPCDDIIFSKKLNIVRDILFQMKGRILIGDILNRNRDKEYKILELVESFNKKITPKGLDKVPSLILNPGISVNILRAILEAYNEPGEQTNTTIFIACNSFYHHPNMIQRERDRKYNNRHKQLVKNSLYEFGVCKDIIGLVITHASFEKEPNSE